MNKQLFRQGERQPMVWIIAFLGYLAGAVLFGAAGQSLGSSLVVGIVTGIVGFLTGQVMGLRRRVDQLDRQLRSLSVQGPGVGRSAPITPDQVVADTRLEASALTLDQELEAELGEGIAPAPTSAPGSGEHRSVRPVSDTHASTSGRWQDAPAKTMDPVWNWLTRYFTEGNLIVRVGVLILLFGVAFLIKYAAERTHIPDGLKLLAIAFAGAALMAVGWYLRQSRELYALALQGGGLGVIYLAVYSGVHLFGLLSPAAGLGLLVILVAFGCLLAVRQNALVLAGLSLAGGFLAPILTSTGEGNHIVLFSYYLLLNGGIAALAWYKSWRLLTLLGFWFTFVIGGLWGMFSYHPGQFVSSQLFLLLFFLLYVAITLVFALRHPLRPGQLQDGFLVFGVPVVALFLQSALMEDKGWNLGWATAALAVFYGALAWGVNRRFQNQVTLVHTFAAIAGIALTLTVPFALGSYWTSALWSLLALGLLVTGRDRFASGFRLGALLLLVGAGMHMLYAMDNGEPSVGLFLINKDVMGSLLLAVVGLVSARLLFAAPYVSLVSGREVALMAMIYGLFWLSIVVLRIILVFTGMSWTVAGIAGSVVAQTSLSIAWTVFGLVTALYAARGGYREVWMVGAGLIALVVIKLFLVDLAGTGTLARVVSFLTVGGLLLLIGYVAPMPRSVSEKSE